MHSGEYGVVSGKAMQVEDLLKKAQRLIGEVEKEQPKFDSALRTHNPNEEETIAIFKQMERMTWCIDLLERIAALKKPPNQSGKRPHNVSFTYAENQWPNDDHEICTCANYESSLEDYESRFPKWRTVLALLDKYNKLSFTLEEASSKAQQPSLPLVILAQKVTYLAHSIYELSGGLFEDNVDRSCDKETDIKLEVAKAEGMMRQTLTTLKTNLQQADKNYTDTKSEYATTQPNKRLDKQLPADCSDEFFNILQCVEDKRPCSEETARLMILKLNTLVDAMKDSRNALWRSIRYLEAARQCCSNVIELEDVPGRFDKRRKNQFDAKTLRLTAAIECVQTRLIHGVKELPIKPGNGRIRFPAKRAIALNKWHDKRKRQKTSNQ